MSDRRGCDRSEKTKVGRTNKRMSRIYISIGDQEQRWRFPSLWIHSLNKFYSLERNLLFIILISSWLPC